MSTRGRFTLTMTLLCLPFVACGGGAGGASTPPPAAPSFSLAVSPASLQIPAGGSGFMTVTVSRLNGFQGTIAVSGIGFPPGVTASGSVPDGTSTLQLPIMVGAGVIQTTFASLQVEGRSGTLVQTAPFSLTVKAPLPPGQVSVDVAQAAGGRQQAGSAVNQVVVLEPLRATAAASASGTVQVRHGFLPSGTPLKP